MKFTDELTGWKGIGLAMFAFVLFIGGFFWIGNNKDFAPMLPYYSALVLGLYYFGLSIAVNTWTKQKDNAKLMNDIQQIKNRLESTVIFTQGVTKVIDDEKRKKNDITLLLFGVLIGLWGGILGGLATNSLFDLMGFSKLSNPIYEQIYCIIAFLGLFAVTVYTLYIIQESMPCKSSKTP